ARSTRRCPPTSPSPIPHGPRSAWLRCRAARGWRSRVCSRLAETSDLEPARRRRQAMRPKAAGSRDVPNQVPGLAAGPSQTAPEQRSVTSLRGVGAFLAERLRRLGVERVQDLLFVLPLRYEDRTRILPIGALMPGVRAAVEGEVQLTEIAYRGRRQLLSRIADGSGFLTLRFFHFSAA